MEGRRHVPRPLRKRRGPLRVVSFGAKVGEAVHAWRLLPANTPSINPKNGMIHAECGADRYGESAYRVGVTAPCRTVKNGPSRRRPEEMPDRRFRSRASEGASPPIGFPTA